MVLKSVQRRVFLGGSDDLAPVELAHNTRNLALGLAYIGFTGSTKEAAEIILQGCVGGSRPSGILPRADTTSAIAFLKTIEELGGLGDTAGAVVDTLTRVKAAADERARPFSDAWVSAAGVFINERVMQAVVNVAATQAPRVGSPSAAAQNSTMRRRVKSAV